MSREAGDSRLMLLVGFTSTKGFLDAAMVGTINNAKAGGIWGSVPFPVKMPPRPSPNHQMKASQARAKTQLQPFLRDAHRLKVASRFADISMKLLNTGFATAKFAIGLRLGDSYRKSQSQASRARAFAA